MKKIFFFAAIAALALSSCSSDERVQAEQPVVEDGAVLFSAYQGRANRAYSTDEATTTPSEQNITLSKLSGDGFGVFAYEQGEQELVSYLAGNTYPNFMYNQKVAAQVATWEFPAEITETVYNTLDTSERSSYYNAVSEGKATRKTAGESVAKATFDALTDAKLKALATAKTFTPSTWEYSPLKYWPNNNKAYVSFQAYAPHNENVEVAFGPAYNGVGVRYNTAEGKDLLWGATDDGATKTSYYDQTKPLTTDKTTFYFKHALNKIDFTVSYFTNNEHTSGTGLADGQEPLDANTTIVVRNIRLVGSLPSQGVLSLYDGKWTIERTAENTGFNTADLVYGSTDGSVWTTATPNGTLTETVYAIKPAKSMMVIPTATATPVHVEVTYDVITVDPNNPSNNSTVTNTVSSKDANKYPDGHGFSGITLTAGNWTTVNIHLGLTSAKFDAHVVDWNTTSTTHAVDLPNND